MHTGRLGTFTRARKGFDKPFGIAVTDFAQLPSLARTLDTKRRQADRLEEKIAGSLKAINFQRVDDLQTFPCPDAAAIQAEIDRNAALEQVRIKQVENITNQTSILNTASAEMERLNKAGEVPTDTVIASARQERHGAWLPIREAYLADRSEGIRQIPVEQRAETAVRFEEHVDKADRLSDRKSKEAKRIAALDLAEKQRNEAITSLATLTAARKETEKSIAEARQAWADAWPQAAGMQGDLARLKGIVEEREAILRLSDDLREIRKEIERLDADFAPRLEMLILAEERSGLTPDSNASFASRIQAATQAIMIHQDAYNDFRGDQKNDRDNEGPT